MILDIKYLNLEIKLEFHGKDKKVIIIKFIKSLYYKILSFFAKDETENILDELNGNKPFAIVVNKIANDYNNDNLQSILNAVFEKLDYNIQKEAKQGNYRASITFYNNLNHKAKVLIKQHYKKNKFKVYITPIKQYPCSISVSWKYVK